MEARLALYQGRLTFADKDLKTGFIPEAIIELEQSLKSWKEV